MPSKPNKLIHKKMGTFYLKKVNEKNLIFKFFFHKYKVCIVGNSFIARIVFISQKIFVLRLFKMAENENAPGLKRGLLSNFW